MIICLTFADNDFSHYLENFCEGLRDRMFSFYEDEYPERTNFDFDLEYLKAATDFCKLERERRAKRVKLMRPENRFSQESEEYKEICDEVKRLWYTFAKKIDMQRWTPNVSIQYSFEEKWENGEVVYYFTPYDKWITQ